MYESLVTEFRVGAVLSRSLSILVRNLIPFGTLGLIFTSPLFLIGFVVGALPETLPGFAATPAEAVAFVGAVFAFLLFVAMYQLFISTVAYGTFQDLRGRQVGVVDCIRRGLSTVLPVIGVAFLSALAIGLGHIAFVIPGWIALVTFWVAVPVEVVERPGVIASMKRSAGLTKGHRWQIFGIFIVNRFLDGITNGIIDETFEVVTTGQGLIVAIVLSHLLSVFFLAWGAVTAAVAYHDLRGVKEGTHVHEIAAIFD